MPGSRHGKRANAAQRQHRCVQEKVGELRRQPVACRNATEFCDQSVKAPPGGGLDRLGGDGAKNMVRHRGLGDQLLDCDKPLFAFAADLAGSLRQPAEHADAIDLCGKGKPGPGSLGCEFET